jgi:hypothetical protein
MRVVGFILRHKIIFISLLIFVGLLLYYILFTMPNAQAAAYTAKMRPGVASIKELFNKQAETATLPIFADPDIPLADKQAQLASIADVNQKTLVALEHLNGDASQLDSAIVLPGNEYRQASELKAKLLPVIGQSQEVLTNYTLLIDFLAYNNDIQTRLQPHLAQGGSLPESVRQDLKREAQKLANFQLPAEFRAIQGKMVDNVNKMITNNQSMSAMQASNQALGYELFGVITQPSQTLRSVVELPEKLQSNNL